MPIAVGTHFKQSMAGVAKQSGAGLTAAMASAVNARGLFSTGRAANAFEKPMWRVVSRNTRLFNAEDNHSWQADKVQLKATLTTENKLTLFSVGGCLLEHK